jgi:hypothetical protein
LGALQPLLHPYLHWQAILERGLPSCPELDPQRCGLGLDQSQVRLYHAILRHTILVMAALAICAVTAAQLKDKTSTQAPMPVHPGQPPPADPGKIALTVPEVRRLIAATARPSPPGHAEHWSGWTRSHQARARWLHTGKTRPRPEPHPETPGQLANGGCRTSSMRTQAQGTKCRRTASL